MEKTLTLDRVVINFGLDKDGYPAYLEDNSWPGMHYFPRAKQTLVDRVNGRVRNGKGQGGKKSERGRATGRGCGAHGRGRLVSVCNVNHYLPMFVISFWPLCL